MYAQVVALVVGVVVEREKFSVYRVPTREQLASAVDGESGKRGLSSHTSKARRD